MVSSLLPFDRWHWMMISVYSLFPPPSPHPRPISTHLPPPREQQAKRRDLRPARERGRRLPGTGPRASSGSKAGETTKENRTRTTLRLGRLASASSVPPGASSSTPAPQSGHSRGTSASLGWELSGQRPRRKRGKAWFERRQCIRWWLSSSSTSTRKREKKTLLPSTRERP